MEELTSVVLSGIAWDALKKGIKISANYLKEKLSNWLLDISAPISQTIEKNYGLNVGFSTGTIVQTNYYSGEKPRDQCVIEGGAEPSVYADIIIPTAVKKREGCQFSMILFSYIPSENWLNYFDAGYRMKFSMETSDSIRQVQFK